MLMKLGLNQLIMKHVTYVCVCVCPRACACLHKWMLRVLGSIAAADVKML